MIQQTLEAERFNQQMRDSLQHETLNSRAVTFARHANVYTCGDQDEMVYFIKSGQIKLLLLSPEGKECLLAIHSSGDIFGELCFSRVGRAATYVNKILKGAQSLRTCRWRNRRNSNS